MFPWYRSCWPADESTRERNALGKVTSALRAWARRGRFATGLRMAWDPATKSRLARRPCNKNALGEAVVQRNRAWRGRCVTRMRLAREFATGLRLARRPCNKNALGVGPCNENALGEEKLPRETQSRCIRPSSGAFIAKNCHAKRVFVAFCHAKRNPVAVPPRETQSRCDPATRNAIPLRPCHTKSDSVAGPSHQAQSCCTSPTPSAKSLQDLLTKRESVAPYPRQAPFRCSQLFCEDWFSQRLLSW